MPNKADNIELMSNEVQDILGAPPHWIVRIGTGFVFLFIAIILWGCWLIKYPTIISASVQIVSTHPVSPIIARSGGQLVDVFVVDSQKVKKNMILAVIDNSANLQDMLLLVNLLDELNPKILEHKYDFELPVNLQLGEVQGTYYSFVSAYYENNNSHVKDKRERKKEAQKKKLEALIRYKLRMEEQLELKKQEYEIIKNQVERSQKLYDMGGLSQAEYEDAQCTLIQSLSEINSAEITIIDTENDINDLKSENDIAGVERKENVRKSEIKMIELIKNLESDVSSWFNMYVLKSPIDGIVAINKLWSANQYAESGDQVFTIIPLEEGEILGRVTLDVEGAGRIKIRQNVNIKFDDYPYQEYGQVSGIVKSKSLVSLDDGYIVEVTLPNGLESSYHKQINFCQNMKGTAEIITQEERLLVRFFNPIKAVFQ